MEVQEVILITSISDSNGRVKMVYSHPWAWGSFKKDSDMQSNSNKKQSVKQAQWMLHYTSGIVCVIVWFQWFQISLVKLYS